MGYFRYAVLAVVVGCAVKFFYPSSDPELRYEVGGHVHPDFHLVYEVFKHNFLDGLETDGAAFAVYKDGVAVVDLWGGYANVSSRKPWEKDTMAIVFSSTKAVASLCIALLVDRHMMNYDDLVTNFWPEFGKHGKANVTIRMLVDHEAGLAGIDEELTIERAKDFEILKKIFEDQKPNWSPGQKRGYHAVSFGWLLDQIVRRVDEKHRSLGKFFDEEIAKPHGIEFFIGLPKELEYRVATVSFARFSEIFKKLFNWVFLRLVIIPYSPFSVPYIKSAFTNPKWIMSTSENGIVMLNTPEFHAMEIPAANGIGTAESLAKLFSLVISGKVLTKNAMRMLMTPVQENVYDEIIGWNLSYGWGFIYVKNPFGQYILGHPGYGGQNVKIDFHNNLSFAYVTNKMKPEIGDETETFKRLKAAVYDSVKMLNEKRVSVETDHDS